MDQHHRQSTPSPGVALAPARWLWQAANSPQSFCQTGGDHLPSVGLVDWIRALDINHPLPLCSFIYFIVSAYIFLLISFPTIGLLISFPFVSKLMQLLPVRMNLRQIQNCWSILSFWKVVILNTPRHFSWPVAVDCNLVQKLESKGYAGINSTIHLKINAWPMIISDNHSD